MAASMSPAVIELSANSVEIFLPACDILLKLASNVIKEPSNTKFRAIRASNPKIMDKLLPVSGAMQCLFEMGFEEVTNSHRPVPKLA